MGKPEKQADALDAIDAHLLKTGSSLQSFVHRGHSYHLGTSLDKLGQRDIPLMILGSCGGYTALSSALKCSANADIIATQGTGTMLVNDPLLREVNSSISTGKDIEWDPLWKRLDQQINDPRFDEYINPAQNIATRFLKKAEEISNDEKTMRALVPSGLNLTGFKSLTLPEPGQLQLPPSLPAPTKTNDVFLPR